MKLSIIIAILAIGSLGVAQAAGDGAAGKAVFEKKCQMCHGERGDGKPAIAKALKIEMRSLSSTEVQAKPDPELRKDIVSGNGKMKPVKLGDAELTGVIAFIRTLGKK